MRIVLYTGKGGVGKTSVAAAAALCCADRGERTVILSTDPAHSLADSFDVRLGADPVQITERLWGQEVDIYHEIAIHWGSIQNWLAAFMEWGGLDEIIADEMTVLPGMEELASLLQIVRHYQSGSYDTIIVDCAPTGETLRLLSFPEVMRWYLEKVFPVERRAAKLVRPLIRSFVDMPLPGDDVYSSVEDLFRELAKIRTLLSDPELASVRLVVNPEKMVIKEAHRTYTYLNLFGYSTDAVICNRVLPEELNDGYFDNWKSAQQRYRTLIDESFAPVPILSVPFFENEVVGVEMLRKMADRLFDERGPSEVLYRGRAQTITRTDEGYLLTLPLPFISKGDVDVLRTGDELVVHVGNQRRNLILPRSLVPLEIREARLDGDELRVRFVGVPGLSRSTGRRAAG